jgi:two-component system response regulator AtoC
MKRVLVVDDERRMRRTIQIAIEQIGIESLAADSGAVALETLRRERVDLVLADLKMPEMDGLELLAHIREEDPEIPVIVLTAYGTIESAVAAMKLGAFDYVLKPFDTAALARTIENALALRQYRSENRFLREQIRGPLPDDGLGRSDAMRRVQELIDRIAPTASPVLVTGETGVGKEVVAKRIHDASPRHEKLFVPINCAAIPAELLESELFGHARGAFTGAVAERAGKFQLADGGTLFLDEIGDMPATLQAKLLRVLEENVIEPVGSNKRIAVDVRFVAATHRDLPARIRDGAFREDLYYRLAVFVIDLPPLRERREDLAPLAQRFLDQFRREVGKPPLALSAAAVAVLAQHAWPGNVRELRNVMERAAVLCPEEEVSPDFFRHLLGLPAEGGGDLAPTAPLDFALEPALDAYERHLILRALRETSDNKAQAAKLLGIGERTLWHKLKKHEL